jgi:hypothetical protein
MAVESIGYLRICQQLIVVRVHHIVNPECNSIDGKRLTTS